MDYTEVFAWGADQSGQLGLGRKKTRETYNSPKFFSFNILISKLSCGGEHSCFISKAGHVYSMGSNNDGRLGFGSTDPSQTSSPSLVEALLPHMITHIACGWAHTLAANSKGVCYAWGQGKYGALGVDSLDTCYGPITVKLPREYKVLSIAAGNRHSGAICDSEGNQGALFMWGAGDSGQLGTSKKENELLPVKLEGVERVQGIALGAVHSLILSETGRVLATGGNSFGQLGIGDKSSYNFPVKVKGLEGVNIVKIDCVNYSAGVSDSGKLYV